LVKPVSESKVVKRPTCGQNNRVRGSATGAPHCPKCGRALPWLVEAGEADFEAVVEQSPLPVLVDFWAAGSIIRQGRHQGGAGRRAG